MLQKYLELVKNASESLSHLGGSDATWTDYFTVVGYELLLILAGILIFTGAVVLIAVPVLVFRKIILSNITGWRKYDKRIQAYDLFVQSYKNKITGICGQPDEYISAVYPRLVSMFEQYHIPYHKKEEYQNWYGFTCNLPRINESWLLSIRDVKPEELGDFADVFQCKKKRRRCIICAIGLCILFLLLYAAFAVPLVLMFVI